MTFEFPTEFDLDVSRETIERLEIYLALLKKWNPKINLVSSSSLKEAWYRHIVDSSQVMIAADGPVPQWVDLGSGGGFPGAVVAIVARELWTDTAVTLIEADTRKATFLRTVMRETDVTAAVVAERIETIEPMGADIVSARALAPLSRLLDYVDRHLAADGTALLMKGANVKSELSAALKYWQFKVEELPSLTESGSVVLKLRELHRV